MLSVMAHVAQVRGNVPFFFLPSALLALVLRDVVFSLGMIAVVVKLQVGTVSVVHW